MQATAKLAVNGAVSGGCLGMEWSFSATEYPREAIQHFADEWAQALSRVAAVGSNVQLARSTPSDWPLCGLTQAELDRVLEQLPAKHTAGSVLPLTSLQVS